MWRLLVAAVLFAFSLQAHLAQTHIHEAVTAASAPLIQSPAHNKSPVDNSPVDCPFCQMLTHVGSFLVPDDSFVLPAAQWIVMSVTHDFLAGTGTTANHSWQGRAPPSF